MLVIAHSAHWLLEAGPLLVVPVVVLVYWLRAARDRRRGRVDRSVARQPAPPAPRRAVADERPPHA